MATSTKRARSSRNGVSLRPVVGRTITLVVLAALVVAGCGLRPEYSEAELQEMIDEMTVEASRLTRLTFRPMLRDLDDGVYGPFDYSNRLTFEGEPRLQPLCEELARLEIDLYQRLAAAGQQDDDDYVFAYARYISLFSTERVDDIFLGLADLGFVELPGVDLSTSVQRDYISGDEAMMDLIAEAGGELDGFDVGDFIRSTGGGMQYEVTECVKKRRDESIFADVNERLGIFN